MTYRLTWLPTVLRAAGLQVHLCDGWQTRGHGDMGAIYGVICHHTAGPQRGTMPSLDILIHGRPDLAGPLCHLGLGRDGTYYVIAAGLAYHAGAGAYQGMIAGNSRWIGIEAENTGIGAPHAALYDPWPAVQLDAYRRGVAALLTHQGLGPERCIGHKEWTRRKIDPHTIDMAAFRREVALLMPGVAAPTAAAPLPHTAGRLQEGDHGPQVGAVQAALARVLGTPMAVDDQFGPRTTQAVRTYQARAGLVVDGVVGPITWRALGLPGVPA